MIPGCILKIKLENFMTYEKLVYEPIERLNIIYGANGTGKSSILCAIILGLGGNATVAGRAKSISQYIKTGCDRAKIEIELYDPTRNNAVMRQIERNNTTTWFINRKMVSGNVIEQLLKSYNIQPDNLCQVLPQEKIESFAKMNDRERLRNTLKTIGNVELYDTFMKLKDSPGLEAGYKNELNELQEKLDEGKNAAGRLQVIVNCIKERQDLLDRLTLVKQRLAWQKYVKAYTVYERLKNKFLKSKKNCKIINNKKNVLRKKASIFNNKAKSYEQRCVSAKNKAKEMFDGINLKIYDITNKNKDINNLRIEMEQKDQIIQQYKNDVKTVENEIEVLRDKLENEKSLEDELKSIRTKNLKLGEKMDDVMGKKIERESAVKSHSYNFDNIERQIGSLENVSANKLNTLRNKYPDSIQAMNWLENNRHRFNGQIYPPMVMEITVKDSKNSMYVENMIPERDLISFLCEDSQDAADFLSILKDQLKLKVNVVTAPKISGPVSSVFKPNIPINQLTRFGFQEYILDMIEAPELIMKYLAHSFNLHNVPVGNDKTFQLADSVPKTVRVFFSDRHKISLSTSQYSGSTLSKCFEIRKGYMLDTVNKVQLNELYKKRNLLNNEINAIKQDINGLDEEYKILQSEKHSIDQRKNEISKIQHEQQVIQNLYNRKINDLSYLKSNVGIGVAEEKQKIERKIHAILSNILEMHRQLKPDLENYSKASISAESLQLAYKYADGIKRVKVTQLRKFEVRTRNVLERHSALERAGRKQKRIMREYYTDAIQMTNGQRPTRRHFKNFNQFVNLDTNPKVLVELIHEYEAKIRCVLVEHNADEVLRDFEQRTREINRLEQQIVSKTKEKDAFVEEINNLKRSLMPQIEELISEINVRFSKLFSDMNCVGEIVLYKGGNTGDNYDEYGIHIKVKFREEFDLQILDNRTQSGGERTLTIAIYLLSLQDLSCVPFRCVDEINQGLDMINEQRINKLLSHIGTKPGAPQYFLLTPKFPKGITVSDNILFSFTHNGVGVSLDYMRNFTKINKYLMEKAENGMQE